MKKVFLVLLVWCAISVMNQLFAQKDTVRIYYLKPVETTAQKNPLDGSFKNIGTDYQSDILNKDGFLTLRRGGYFTQDLYMEGYKRNDIAVLVDGECCNSACPNRMDAYATRINPFEISSVEIVKNSALLQSGLAGKINYHRIVPQEELRLRGGLTSGLVSGRDIEAFAGVEGLNQMINFRYATGKGYQSGNGKTTEELYGYRDNYNYNYGSISFAGRSGDLGYGASFNLADKIRFPYLQMDEKHSYTWMTDVSFMDQKIFANYTDHLMDNTLRTNNAIMMSTNAKVYTVGLTGELAKVQYNVSYRNWDADNKFRKDSTIKIDNRLMPRVNRLDAVVSHVTEIGESGFVVGGKLGYNLTTTGDEANKNIYSTLYPGFKSTKNNLIAGLSLGYTYDITDELPLRMMSEFSYDAPAPEEYFISVKKPGKTPDWMGNPNLKQPLKAGARANMTYDFLDVEVYGSFISNYVNPYKDSIPLKKQVQTYSNINAVITGINFGVDFKYFTSDISFIYGQNLSKSAPLSEIAPASITSMVIFPQFLGIKTFLRHIYTARQDRFDKNLYETPSVDWNRFDVGLTYTYSKVDLTLEVINLLNKNYYNYLSYARNPFSSQTKVYEPGTVVKFSIIARYE